MLELARKCYKGQNDYNNVQERAVFTCNENSNVKMCWCGVGLQFLRCRKIYLFQQVCKALNWKLFETAMTGR
jgi:hypothetical protein